MTNTDIIGIDKYNVRQICYKDVNFTDMDQNKILQQASVYMKTIFRIQNNGIS